MPKDTTEIEIEHCKRVDIQQLAPIYNTENHYLKFGCKRCTKTCHDGCSIIQAYREFIHKLRDVERLDI